MNRETELALIEEIGKLLAGGTTSMAPGVAHVEVAKLVGATRTRSERDVLFRRYPQVVAPSAAVPAPGNFITEDIAGMPLLIVRDSEGVVRVMVNACRHRGNRLTNEASGNRRMFSCAYYAWTYNQQGTCRSIVDKVGFEGVDRKDLGLVTFPTEERHGLIWMLPNANASLDVASYLGTELDAELAGYLPHTSHVFESEHSTQQFNWKFGVNTFQELFHLAFLHKATLGKSFISNVSAFRSYRPHQRLTVARSTFPELLTKSEEERSLFPHCSLVYMLFPNVILTWQLDHIELWRMSPSADDDGSCDVALWLMTNRAPETESATRHWRRNWEVVMNTVYGEDFATMKTIQDNMSTGLLQKIVYGRNEIGLQDYHHNITAAVEGAQLAGGVTR
ncbi:aromatic ring-hydroxylating dioxygenase subunit alpha [Streptomyces sp. NPDC101455]|uniref:aromatic ring-hydroxylating oxygenase subunit alpha n=1 Tax=Streptomyces sp. NPDC101455 TaxID=3366142 RepID=UPI00381318B5